MFFSSQQLLQCVPLERKKNACNLIPGVESNVIPALCFTQNSLALKAIEKIQYWMVRQNELFLKYLSTIKRESFKIGKTSISIIFHLYLSQGATH